jgi:hypothetical protein
MISVTRVIEAEPIFDAALRGIRGCAATALMQSCLSKRNALHEIIALAQNALNDRTPGEGSR